MSVTNKTTEDSITNGGETPLTDLVPLQPASLDIWEKKYRLTSKSGEVIDHTIDDTYRRIADTLADVESV